MHGAALPVKLTAAGARPDPATSIRILVAIASYGNGNDRYLRELITTYRSMPFAVDIVVLSNIEKQVGDGIRCLVGLPDKNPWSLPFGHKKLFAEHADHYDLFIYSEDDMLVTERHVRAFLAVSEKLGANEVAGFLRIEKGDDGRVNYPDWHSCFHWDCSSVRSRDEYVLAHFTNEHAACYLLTQSQLKAAIRSGGFLVDPHEKKYDLLCTAATDPYTQCGMTKLIPVSHIDDFTVHHMSNKYLNVVGIGAVEFNRQVDTLVAISQDQRRAGSLIGTETTMPETMYSKDYYSHTVDEVLAAVPASAKRILSVGYGLGRNELALAERDRDVTVIPLDAVCASQASANGLRVAEGNLDDACAKLGSDRFDCILYLNVLHLAEDPSRLLSRFRSLASPSATIVVQSPNMLSARVLRRSFRDCSFYCSPSFAKTRTHAASVPAIRGWCQAAGYKVERAVGINSRPMAGYRGRAGSLLNLLMASEIVVTAQPV